MIFVKALIAIAIGVGLAILLVKFMEGDI